MKKKVILLRFTLWWGIIADAIEAFRMASMELFVSSSKINIEPDIGLKFGLLYGMPVMMGWSFILFWADRKPLERRGVLLCLIPVILGYFIVQAFAIQNGLFSLLQMIPTFILQGLLLILSAISYVITKKSS